MKLWRAGGVAFHLVSLGFISELELARFAEMQLHQNSMITGKRLKAALKLILAAML